MRESLSWAAVISKASIKERKQAVKIVLEGLKSFINGKLSNEGEQLVANLKKNCTLIGFCPNIMYIKVDGDEEDLGALHVHPFGQRAVLYKVKKQPMLIITNSSIELNDSALRKIKGNEDIEEVFNVLGITG